MRKIIMMLLVLAMTVCGAVGIAACGKDPEKIQDQGQIEQNKDKDKEEVKPGQNEGNENKEDEGKEEGKGDTGSENPAKPGENDPPVTPEPQKPNPETPPQDEESKEEDKEEDKKDDGKEEEPPQGDEPGTGDSDEKEGDSDPNPNPNPNPNPEPKPEPKPEPEPEPEDDCEHTWTYTVIGDDLNNRMHYGECTKCHKKTGPTNCTLGTTSKHVDPTCTEDGYDSYTCSVCKIELKAYGFSLETFGHKYPKTGHNFDGQSWTHVEGTSHTVTATASQHERHCGNKNCTYVEIAECEFTGEIKAPTCEKAGEDTRECKECHYHLQSEGPMEPLDHVLEYISKNDGKSHKIICKRDCCAGKVITESENCTFEEISRKEGSCTEGTTVTLTCKFCKATKTETKQGTSGHQYTNSNFCDKCGYNGLKFGTRNIGGYVTDAVIYNAELKEVKKIFLVFEEGKDRFPAKGIAPEAFKSFSQLEEIYIPNSVKAIAANAFANSSLKTLCFESDETAWGKIVTDDDTKKFFSKVIEDQKNIQVKNNQDGDTIKQEWGLETETNAATIAALPAGDNKRLYA